MYNQTKQFNCLKKKKTILTKNKIIIIEVNLTKHLPELWPGLVSSPEVRPLSVDQYSSAAAKHPDPRWSYKPASVPTAWLRGP